MSEPKFENFEWSEFACKCGCGENKTNIESAIRLQKARSFAGIPFMVNSAYRCRKHNADSGSKSNVHPRGYAFDIAVSGSRDRYKVMEAMILAGFNRIGVAKDFVHGDDDPAQAPEVSWLY